MDSLTHPAVTSYPLRHTEEGGGLAPATFVGFATVLLGVALWMLFVSAAHVKIGLAAVGIGFLVGWAMHVVGRGHNPTYGYLAAAIALLGCVAGDFLTDCLVAAEFVGQPTLDLLCQLTPATAASLCQQNLHPLDALLYVLAVALAYRNAFTLD